MQKDPSLSRNSSRLAGRGRKEKSSAGRTPITRRETLVLAGSSVQLIFGSWAVGVQLIPLQWLFLAMSVITFAMLFIPLRSDALYGQFKVVSLTPAESLQQLLRFPLFWLGLVLAAYVIIQCLNPAYSFQRLEDGRWFMQRESFTRWLPAGVAAPFDVMSGWRQLLMYVPVWFLMCSLWVGLRSRRAIRILILVLLGNGIIWAIVAVGQHLGGGTKLLGLYETARILGSYTKEDGTTGIRYGFFGALVNMNHAAFYLVSVLACCLALFLHFHERATLAMKKSGPHLMLFALAGLIAGAAFFTLSRGGLIATAALCLAAGVFFLWQLKRLGGFKGNPIPAALLAVGALALGTGVLLFEHPRTIERELQSTQQLIKAPQTDARWQLYKSGWELHEYRKLTGWGAGAFRYFYVAVLQRNPEIDHTIWRLRIQPDGSLKYVEVPNFFTHLHNDWLEALIELGRLGCIPILLAFLWSLWKLIRHRRLINAPALMLLTGTCTLAGLGFVEFPLRLPGLAALFACLWVLSLRYLEAEHERMLALSLRARPRSETPLNTAPQITN